MFENLKITAKMQTQICFNDFLRLDCILSAAKAKEILKSDYYLNPKQNGDLQLVTDTLSEFLKFNEKLKVFHASCATDGKEFVTAYSKRWNSGKDGCVKFKGKGKQEIDTMRGFFKAYRNPLVYHTIPEVVFYASGDKAEIERLLKENIAYLGKKSSQGYGKVKEWTVEIIDEDKSIFNNGKLMRFVGIEEYINNGYPTDESLFTVETATIPPAYRKDTHICFMPNFEGSI